MGEVVRLLDSPAEIVTEEMHSRYKVHIGTKGDGAAAAHALHLSWRNWMLNDAGARMPLLVGLGFGKLSEGVGGAVRTAAAARERLDQYAKTVPLPDFALAPAWNVRESNGMTSITFEFFEIPRVVEA